MWRRELHYSHNIRKRIEETLQAFLVRLPTVIKSNGEDEDDGEEMRGGGREGRGGNLL